MLTEVIDIYFLCGRFMLQLADQSKCLQIKFFIGNYLNGICF